MVNFGMHKQDIMHKELCGGGVHLDKDTTPIPR